MKKLFAVLMSAMMLVCFMPTMAFADAPKTWDNNGKFKVELKSGETTAVAEVYDDYSVKATVTGRKVDASKVDAVISMKNVESLGVMGERSHTIGLTTTLTPKPAIDQWFNNVFNFKAATVNGRVDGNEFAYDISDFANDQLTATPKDTEAVRTAWHALTANVTPVSGEVKDSKLVVEKGAYLQIGDEKLVFDDACMVNPSDKDKNAEQEIRKAAHLDTNATPAKKNIEMKIPAGSKIQIGGSVATLNKTMYVRSDIKVVSEGTEGKPLATLRDSKELYGILAYAVNLTNTTIGNISGKTVSIDVLSECNVTVDGKDAVSYAYGDTFTLDAAGTGYKWIDKKDSDKEVAAGTVTVTQDMELVKKSTSTGGGGYVPSTPTTSTLDATKANAEKSITAGAAANKYDDAEQAEINKIVEKAKADIKAAKTEAEVKAIEEAAQKEIETILTTADKEEIKAVQGVTGDKFVAKSKLTKLNGKKAVRITWNVPKGMKLDGFHVYKSSKRYSGYGKKPYFTTTKTSYINNKELEDGQTYYYKVRGFKVIKGQTVYTGYSTNAIRTIK